MRQENIVNYVLAKRAQYAAAGPSPRERATFATYCGAAHDALADVRGLHVVLTDPDGVWAQRGRKLALEWRHFWEYGCALAAFATKLSADPVGEGWEERQGGAPPLAAVEADGPDFTPPRGAAEEGGPSKRLKRALGILTNMGLTADELMLKLFLYFFDEDVVKLICDATNSKAKEVSGGRRLPAVVVPTSCHATCLPANLSLVCRRKLTSSRWMASAPGAANLGRATLLCVRRAAWAGGMSTWPRCTCSSGCASRWALTTGHDSACTGACAAMMVSTLRCASIGGHA